MRNEQSKVWSEVYVYSCSKGICKITFRPGAGACPRAFRQGGLRNLPWLAVVLGFQLRRPRQLFFAPFVGERSMLERISIDGMFFILERTPPCAALTKNVRRRSHDAGRGQTPPLGRCGDARSYRSRRSKAASCPRRSWSAR